MCSRVFDGVEFKVQVFKISSNFRLRQGEWEGIGFRVDLRTSDVAVERSGFGACVSGLVPFNN